jgi:hypothetical protein
MAISAAFSLLMFPSAGRSQNLLSFNHVVVDRSGPEDPWGKTVADINRDGALDLVVGGYAGGGLVWYENPSWTVHRISGGQAFRTDHEAADVDRDSSVDIISLGTDESARSWLGWFRNPGSGTDDWLADTIASVELHDIEAGDLNGDGRVDVVGRNQEEFGSGRGDTVFVYLQEDSLRWSAHRILCDNGEGLKLADLNRDGRPDIIINGSWFENTGAGTSWVAHEYTSGYTHRSISVDAADVDGDSLADIVVTPSEPAERHYRISWFKAPPDPTQPDWPENIVEEGVETVHHFVGAADFDNDGMMDIATARMNTGQSRPDVTVFVNRGQGLAWEKRIVATTGSHSMRIADFDGNGSKDLFGANWRGRVSDLWLNEADMLPYSLQISGGSGGVQQLEFGLAEYATDSLDAHLREEELGFPPPPGQFDSRFVGVDGGTALGRGTHRDLRRGDSATVGKRFHEVLCQSGPGGSLSFRVALPPQVSVRFRAELPGGNVDTLLEDDGTFTVSGVQGAVRMRLEVIYVLSRPRPLEQLSPAEGALEVGADPIVSWAGVELCTAYHLQVGTNGAAGGVFVVDTVTADTAFQLPILDSLTAYWWKVSGINSAGEGEFGLPWVFQTKEFVADPRILGFWRLNDDEGSTVEDLTLKPNNGTAVGTSVVEARYGSGREFNGATDYIDLPESMVLLHPGRKFTIEAWLYLNAYPHDGELGTVVSTGNDRDFELSVTPEGRLRGHLFTESAPDSIDGVSAIPLHAWTHVSMTCDGSYARLFVNGIQDARQERSDPIGGSPGPEDILIGGASRGGSVTNFFAGRLDDVRLMKIARKPDDFPLQLPPRALTAVPGPGTVALSWENGGGGAAIMTYRVYRGTDSNSVTLLDSTSSTQFTDASAVPFHPNIYRVTAVDVSGFESVSSVDVRAASNLNRPELLSPSYDQTSVPLRATFVWDPVREAESYRLQVYADSGLTQLFEETVTVDTTYTLDGILQNGTRYLWRVRGLRGQFSGAWSAPGTFVTLIQTPRVIDLVSPPDHARVSADSVLCIWTASLPDVDRYTLEFSPDSMFVLRSADSTLADTTTVVRGLVGPGPYWWRVRAMNGGGWGEYSAPRSFTVTVSSVDEEEETPRHFGLSQNYPNPFNPKTTIAFQLPISSNVRLSVFDLLGREVAVLVDERMEAGNHQAVWDGGRAASGFYIYRITAGTFTRIRRMLLVK